MYRICFCFLLHSYLRTFMTRMIHTPPYGERSFIRLRLFGDDRCKPNIFILCFQNKLSITAKCTSCESRRLPSTNIKIGRGVVTRSTFLFSVVYIYVQLRSHHSCEISSKSAQTVLVTLLTWIQKTICLSLGRDTFKSERYVVVFFSFSRQMTR